MSPIVTAIVLSAQPYERRWPGLEVLPVISKINDALGYLLARNCGVAGVTTQWLMFLGDDDDLPPNHVDVIQAAVELAEHEKADLVIGDEVWVHDDGSEEERRGGCYSQQAHLANLMLVHQAAIYRTRALQNAVSRMPLGHYWPEMMHAWEVAKTGPVAYVPLPLYRWRCRINGMHTRPWCSISQVRSMLWSKANP